MRLWLLSIFVNVIWRTLLVMWRARRRLRREGPIGPGDIGRIRVTTLPTDIDVLRHMNNGRYLSLFDLGRWDLLGRTGMTDAMKRNDWYAVVSAETVTFRKSLQLWQRFDIESRMLGHDDKAIYLEHRAVVDGEIYAKAIIRARMLKRSGGTLASGTVRRSWSARGTARRRAVGARVGDSIRSSFHSCRGPEPVVMRGVTCER